MLERLGHAVDFHPAAACCGQPAFNAGFWPDARKVAARTLDCYAGAEAVVVPSGSCGAMLRVFFPELFEGTPRHAEAAALAGKTFEFSQFLVDQLGVTDVGAAFEATVTFHDGCHGLRELGVKSQPRTLLENVRGLELVEMEDAETCCGFGGTFAVKFPQISTAMGETKLQTAAATGAEVIVSNDSSCLMQIQGLADRQGRAVRTMHLAEILAKVEE